jgi:hypothetical protein
MTQQKLIQIAFGAFALLLLLLTTLVFLPFRQAHQAMDAFCDQLPAGTPLDGVRALAEAQGYELTVEADGRVVIEDPRLGANRNCSLQFGAPSAASTPASR